MIHSREKSGAPKNYIYTYIKILTAIYISIIGTTFNWGGY